MKYRRRPLEFDVWRFTGAFDLDPQRPEWAAHYVCEKREMRLRQDGKLMVPTLEGLTVADVGDYIVRGVEGEVWAVKPSIFKKTYEPVTDTMLTAETDAFRRGGEYALEVVKDFAVRRLAIQATDFTSEEPDG